MIITKKTELTGHSAAIYAMCIEDDNYIFSGGVDKHVVRWDIRNIDNSEVIVKSSEAIYSLFYYKENNLLFIGTTTGKIHIIDLFKKREIKLLKSHHDKIFDFKLFGSKLISVSADGFIGFTDVNSLKTEQLVKISDERIRSIDIKKDRAVIACGDSHIRVVDLNSYTILDSFLAHEKACNIVQFHPTEELLLSGGWDAHLNLWDYDYNLIKSIPAHNYAIYSIVFSPDNKLFATGSRDKTIKVWDALNPEFPKSITYENLKGHQFSVNRLLWEEKNSNLFSASDDKKIIVWNITNE